MPLAMSEDPEVERMRQHFEKIAHLPPTPLCTDDQGNVSLAPPPTADPPLACKGQRMREAAAGVLAKHARVRSSRQYLYILIAFQRVMYSHGEWYSHEHRERAEGRYTFGDIGMMLWTNPVLRRWRLVREAAGLCAEAARRERWWLAFAERAFHPDAPAVDTAAAEFAALAVASVKIDLHS